MPPYVKKILKNPKFQQFLPYILFALIYLTTAYRSFHVPEGTAYISGIEAIKYSSLIFFSLSVSVFIFIFYPPQFRYTKVVASIFQIILGLLALIYLSSGGQSKTNFNFLLPFYKNLTIILTLVLILSLFNHEKQKMSIIVVFIVAGFIAAIPLLFV